MRNKSSLLLSFFILIGFSVFSQKIQSPEEFLGYKAGERFTYHHRMLAYFQHVAETSPNVQFIEYGKSVEGRPLIAVAISSAENLSNLDALKQTNLQKTGIMEGDAAGQQLPIVWMSYNIHGNEASGAEAAILTLYHLTGSPSDEVSEWLENMIIVLDPCLNPDGREKYAVWFHQVVGTNPNPRRESWEHNEPWPGSRVNHYLFDLNRDWAWQTQAETRQRLAFYYQWMPHVHIDFHEMGYNSPYFFGPGAKPYHEAMTAWQSEFQKKMGEGLSRVFDRNHALYFTSESFDLFSPAFGDTWPTFNGALGFTYEQGGGSRAGLAVITETGDTLSFEKRVDNHYAASIGTLQTAFENRERILKEFNAYFRDGATRFAGDYKSYIIRSESGRDNIRELLSLLDRNNIRYYYPARPDTRVTGFDYATRKDITFTLQKKDIVVPVRQPQSHFVKVLFEPEAAFHDTVSYDLTAWSLPYIYGLQAVATKSETAVHPNSRPEISFTPSPRPTEPPYAYLVEWEDFNSVKFLSALLEKKFTVRYAEKGFEMGKRKYPKGTLVIVRGENGGKGVEFDSLLFGLAEEAMVLLHNTPTGRSDSGKDLGSSAFVYIRPLNIAILKGNGIAGNSVGELWFYFDQEISYPVSLIDVEQVPAADLSAYDLVIMPSGSYQTQATSKLMAFARNGGRLIAMERALQSFEKDSSLVFGKTVTAFREQQKKKLMTPPKDPDSLLIRLEDRRKQFADNIVASSIFRLSFDDSHPASFGLGKDSYIMRRNSSLYPYLPSGTLNIAYFDKNSHMTGFVGERIKKEVDQKLSIGQEPVGRGNIIYVSDSPVYRAFWHTGKILLGNLVFLEPSVFLRQNYDQ